MNDWARRIREGDPRALARAATGIENRDPEALALLRDLADFAGRARIVGITGPPGAGKSTLVDALSAALRARAKTVAIVAVDPTSRRTGGAILGDRIRMTRHHADPGIFIRSMATRGETGGLARATADLVRLMDAAGRDYVLVETVGVGQDEIEIVGLAQVTVVVLVPGMGDDVQAIKAGILEIADVFVINKADLAGADRLETDLEAMLSLDATRQPAIVRTVATEGRGVDALLDAIGRSQARGTDAFVCQPRSRSGQPGSPARGTDAFVCQPGSRSGQPTPPHVVLKVPNLAAAVQALRIAGVPLLDPPPDRAGVFVDPASTGGVLLELVQENET